MVFYAPFQRGDLTPSGQPGAWSTGMMVASSSHSHDKLKSQGPSLCFLMIKDARRHFDLLKDQWGFMTLLKFHGVH